MAINLHVIFNYSVYNVMLYVIFLYLYIRLYKILKFYITLILFLNTLKYETRRFPVATLKTDNYFAYFNVASMTWLTGTEYLFHKWPHICSFCRNHKSVLSSFMTYHRICNNSNTTDATNRAETANPSGAAEFTMCFLCWFLLLCV